MVSASHLFTSEADPSYLFSHYPGLPRLLDAEAVPAMFEDSTHQLWRCDTVDGRMMLKICQHKNLAHSPCWQVIQRLFDLYLPDDLGLIDKVQIVLEQQGRIGLPELVACAGQSQKIPAFMLNRFVEGQMLTQDLLTDAMIEQLAAHIASLHSHESPHWGDLAAPQKTAETWPETLLKTLVNEAARQDIGDPWLSLAVSQLEQISPVKFSPIMLDNRWDQYLFEADQIKALVDIDAFVCGPVELELVLLEYQLNHRQASIFANAYQQVQAMPDLSNVRLSYRFLLFLMNALGETKLDKWMRADTHW